MSDLTKKIDDRNSYNATEHMRFYIITLWLRYEIGRL